MKKGNKIFWGFVIGVGVLGIVAGACSHNVLAAIWASIATMWMVGGLLSEMLIIRKDRQIDSLLATLEKRGK